MQFNCPHAIELCEVCHLSFLIEGKNIANKFQVKLTKAIIYSFPFVLSFLYSKRVSQDSSLF